MTRSHQNSKTSEKMDSLRLLLMLCLCVLVFGWIVCVKSWAADTSNSTSSRSGKEVPVPYSYSPQGKPDPFKPFIGYLKAADQEKSPDRALTPLQKLQVSQLKLVGVYSRGGEAKALIQDPEKKGYIVALDDLVGPNWGRVSRILPDRVIITEKREGLLGKTVEREIVIKLRRPGETSGNE